MEIAFDLPLDFKGTKKTAAFIGSIQDEITLEQVTEQLGSWHLRQRQLT